MAAWKARERQKIKLKEGRRKETIDKSRNKWNKRRHKLRKSTNPKVGSLERLVDKLWQDWLKNTELPIPEMKVDITKW